MKTKLYNIIFLTKSKEVSFKVKSKTIIFIFYKLKTHKICPVGDVYYLCNTLRMLVINVKLRNVSAAKKKWGEQPPPPLHNSPSPTPDATCP